ncbi:MAG: major capsid protein [Micropruina sp.]|uniref:major capsid protein n=1 Tax=Micropruina sp. TaxID=2737536 RepID=UPI0039E57134
MALDLQAILDAASGADAAERAAAIKTTIGDDVTREDLDQLLNESVEKFGALNDTDPSDDDALNGLELLADVISTTREQITGLDARADEIRAQRESLAEKVLGTDPAEAADGDGEEGGDAEATAETSDAAPVEAVAASAGAPKPSKRFNLSSIKDKAPAPAARPAGVAITAAAGVRGVENGSDLDMDGLVAAVQARIAGMPRGGVEAYVKDGVAQIKVAYPDELVASGNNDQAVVDYAGDQNRIEGGLVASGGWCAPSDTLYDVVGNLADANAGLIDVPDIQVKRGGIRYTEGVQFGDVWAGNAGLRQTEAQAIANTGKVLYRPTCPEFAEKRADAVYSGITVGFLQNDAYPEVTKDAIAGVTAVHAHRVNKLTVDAMEAASTAVNLSATLGPSATGSILNGIGLSVTDARYKERAPESLLFDVVLPIWAKETVRADYALRSGIPIEQVTDAKITSLIAERGGRVQWVYDWQDAYATGSAGFGGATALTAYPTTVKALVYPSGTFVRGRGEVINLDTVYDSTMTVANDYLQLFMEEKLLVAKRAHSSRVVTLALGVNGTVGAPQVLDGNGKVVVTP